jgi:hypothetical protein
MTLNLNPPPSVYTANQNVTITPGNDASFFILGDGINPPALSEYIAYDQLTPPGPFLAVTQDGKGNVVYDGGFPKFYNSQYAGASWPGFAAAPAAFKYMYNALNFCRNEEKYAAGNRKVLILGEASTSYQVDSLAADGFKKTLDMICGAAGFVPTYRLNTSYPGGNFDPTVSELDGYVCIIMFSTIYDLTGVGHITQRGVNDLVSIRAAGTGIIFVTDHGVPDGSANSDYIGFYATANRVMINFGAKFQGNFDRTPVNVGFLRANYGDHPLYNGMLDSESIFAGGSESKVIVAQYPHYDTTHPAPVQLVNKQGVNYVRTLTKLTDGSVKAETFVYIIGEGNAPIEPTNPDGSVIRGEIVVTENLGTPSILITPIPQATMFGYIRMGPNGSRIVGEFRYADGVQETYWYQDPANTTTTGPKFRVETGDKFQIQLLSPFEYTNSIDIRVDKALKRVGTPGMSVGKYAGRVFPNNTVKEAVRNAAARVGAKWPKMAAFFQKQGETFEPARPKDFTVLMPDGGQTLAQLMAAHGKGEGLIWDLNNNIYRYHYNGWESMSNILGFTVTISNIFGVNVTITSKTSGKKYFVDYDGVAHAITTP